jgi:phospholipase C
MISLLREARPSRSAARWTVVPCLGICLLLSACGASGEGDALRSATAAAPTPIQHVVVVVKENHTFDNYFGSFPGAEGNSRCQTPSGTSTCPRAPLRTPRDLCHEHSCALTEWAGGAMNGWAQVSSSSSNGDNLAWAQYQESDIPNYWAYARTFTLADHFFANALAPSFPGHMEVLAAQGAWAVGNPNTDLFHPFWGCDQTFWSTVPVLDRGGPTQK